MPRKPTAVLVENQTELGHVIRDLLKDEGYHVVAVRTPDDALGVLREERVDLLVTDLPEGAAEEHSRLAPEPTSVVVQNPFCRVVEVVELSVPGCAEEEEQEDEREPHGDRQEKRDRDHRANPNDDSARRTLPSRPTAPARTMALESGMSTAATSGLTSPAAAAVTATTL